MGESEKRPIPELSEQELVARAEKLAKPAWLYILLQLSTSFRLAFWKKHWGEYLAYLAIASD